MRLVRLRLISALVLVCFAAPAVAQTHFDLTKSAPSPGGVAPQDDAAMRAAAEEFQRSLETEARVSLRNALNPRQTLSLDGKWDFRRAGDVAWTQVDVPGCLQAQIPSLRGQSVSGQYRRRVSIPLNWTGSTWIVFGAADYTARVTVNDRYAGFHEGGYTPFAFDLSAFVRPGDDAEIVVEIEDSAPDASTSGYPFAEIPHGAQEIYGDVSGLWQSVRLEERSATFIKSARITPDIDTSSATVAVTLSETPPSREGALLARVYAQGSSAPVAQARTPLSASLTYQLRLPIPQPRLWTPDSPFLYTLNLSIVSEDGVSMDEFADRFGMRKIETRAGRILLNGKALFLSGALDEGYYPDTDYTVPSETFLRDEFAKAKRLGLNLLRCQLKAPDPLYLQLADEMGLLVWYDLPNVDTLTPKSRARLVDTLRGLSERDANHPSLVIIGLLSNSRGIDLSQQVQRQWLKDVYDFAKKLNPDRLIIDNSAGAGNFHLKTDIASFEADAAIPEQAADWSKWLAEFAGRPSWLFSPYGDSVRTNQEPLLVCGFGSWGLPSVSALQECFGGQLPWWFAAGQGPQSPAGVEQRFSDSGLSLEFGDTGRLARATQEAQLLAYKYQVEEIRRRPEICGYVWRRLADVHGESDGLMDVCRNLKASSRALPIIQQERCIILRPDRRSLTEGDTLTVQAFLSDYSSAAAAGPTRLEWQLDGFPASKVTTQLQGPYREPLPPVTITFTAPQLSAARTSRVLVRWMDGDTVLAQNYEDIRLFSARESTIPLRVKLPEDLPERAQALKWLTSLGAVEATSKLDTDLIVCSHSSPDVEESLKEGGRVLMLADGSDALGSLLPGLSLAPRSLPSPGGASSFVWFRRGGAMQGIPSRSQTQDWGLSRLLPRFAIEGLSGAQDWTNVDAGAFTGWISGPEAFILRAGGDKGRLILTTLDILPLIGSDPLAEALLANMIGVISAESFPVSGDQPLFQGSASRLQVGSVKASPMLKLR